MQKKSYLVSDSRIGVSISFEQLPGYVYICSINYPESHADLPLLNYTITNDIHINRFDTCHHIPEIIEGQFFGCIFKLGEYFTVLSIFF
jgi:hypothetical protein